GAQRGALHRAEELHPGVEVARRQVGRADEVAGLLAGGPEGEDPGVLQVAPDGRTDPDALRPARDAGPQAADPPDDDVDVAAGGRRPVQRVDDLLVDEVVHLDGDAAAGVGRGLGDQLEDPGTEPDGGDDELAVVAPAAVAGEEVEELAQVGADVLVAGEQADVLVLAGGSGVVVAGPDVAVAAQLTPLPPHHQRRLAPGLDADEVVHDVDAGLLQPPGPGEV